MIKKIIIALLSTVLFSFLMAYLNHVPMSEREPNVYYNPLWSTALLFAMYSLPVYLIGGISSSYLIDKLVRQKTFDSKWKRYLTEFVIYGVLGIVVAFIFLMILTITESETHLITGSLLNFMTLGFVASLIFYHVSLIFRK
ncbi:hypothetical protein [Alkalibacillus salilacus]|uniref:Cell shape-determining protein MreD n=1 Tax=Alkalibacillus salilacus TaxID=284582 RepID=A0ABT9VF49_9BACI|nr:hypothetical protein [Alkalibacillus salilacus]MDQ0159485.1 cell shape-determining protein MreD [Alkalibacillus salilacus]